MFEESITEIIEDFKRMKTDDEEKERYKEDIAERNRIARAETR